MSGTSSKSTRGASSAPEAVAPTEASEPPVDDTPAPTPAAVPNTCADCGSSEVIYRTDDPAAEPKDYCATHLPGNITPQMVKEQRGE